MRIGSITRTGFILRNTVIGNCYFVSKACDSICSGRRDCGFFPKACRVRLRNHCSSKSVVRAAQENSDTNYDGETDFLHQWDVDGDESLGKISIPDGAKLMEARGSDDVESPLERMLQSLRFSYESADSSNSGDESTRRKCTSSTATGNRICIRYRCNHGHVIRCLANSLATRYCPSCNVTHITRRSTQKLSLFDLRQNARDNGGKVLSTEYVNARTPITWQCRQGHVWKTSACNIRNGRTWCPECARQRRKLGLTDMHKLAAKFGGECLSDQYISQYVKLEWRCSRGHTFWLAPNNIARSPGGKRKPTWCKICRRMDGDSTKLRQSKRTQSTSSQRSRRKNIGSTG